MTSISELRPQKNQRVIDLVRAAGLDVSDWSNFKGRATKAASNPKYCYEWSFIGTNVVVLNLWFESLRAKNGTIYSQQDGRWRKSVGRATASQVVWKRRAEKFHEAIRHAYFNALPLRVIICDGQMHDASRPNAKASRVAKRLLDAASWAVTEYDVKSGKCVLNRHALPVASDVDADDAELSAFEGAARKRFVMHRHREGRLRAAKLAQVMQENGGRLVCQVPNCGFDFAERYGAIGEGFAHVHHLKPLSALSKHGTHVSLDDLAVVCPNCHAMIHAGGRCRPLQGLIKGNG